MLTKVVSTVSKASVVLLSAASAVWLTLTGHTLLVEGLMLALGAALAAVFFSFRLSEGLPPDRSLSIWMGPLSAVRSGRPLAGYAEARKAA